MEWGAIIQFVQAVGIPAAFAFALLWIIERRLTRISEQLTEALTILRRSGEAMARVAGMLEQDRAKR